MNKSSMNNPSSSDQDGKIVDQAKQAVTHVASNVASQAKEQVNAQFDTRKDKAVETIGNVATAIRETSDKLKGVGPLGDVAGRAADGIESVAEFFEGKQIGDVVRDVEKFARREPALFIGAAFALGLIGGRFLKSSSRSSATGAGGQYASAGAGGYERYESAYGASSFGDEDYLSDADLQDDIDSQRFGAYGSAQRAGRTTQPLGSRTGMGSGTSKGSSMSGSSMSGSSMSGSSMSGSSYGGSSQGSQGSSFGATQASPAGSSFGASSGSGSSGGSSATSTTTTTKTASTPPTPGTSSTSPSTSTSGSSTPKNGLGGGNTGSV
jgi:hypothetical protein